MEHSPSCEATTLSKWPTTGTAAAKAFFSGAEKDFKLYLFFVNLVVSSDYIVYVAKQALESKPWKDKDALALVETDPGKNTQFLRRHRQEWMQMFITRFVDNFQRYLVDLLREVLRKQPAILRTSQTSITLERVLSFSSMDELVNDVAERKITNLTYQGFPELQEWCTERGIPIILSKDSGDSLVEFIASRNLIVHSRGIVDDKYLRTTSDSPFKLGELRELEPEHLQECLFQVSEAVKATDAAAIEKFGLVTIPITEEEKEIVFEERDKPETPTP